MCGILEPLLDEEPYSGPGTPDPEPSALMWFEHPMRLTIELAAKLYLTDRRCIWKFFQPGSNFDPQTMKIDPLRHVDTSGRKVETIQLCIFPAFYMSETLGSRTSTHGNEGTAMGAPDDLSGYQLAAKGLVVV